MIRLLVLAFVACSVIMVFDIRFPGAILVGFAWMLLVCVFIGLFWREKLT